MAHRRIAVGLLLCLAAGTVAADPPTEAWYRGPDGRHRITHMGITLAFGLTYLGSQVFKSKLVPAECRWCEPPAIDRSVRDALVWNDTDRANLYSSLGAYILAPAVGFGLLIAADHDASWARIIDDTLPVAETIAISQVLSNAIKFTVGRQRPYAHYNPGLPPTPDDNASFISGHSSLGFAITAGAGLLCHWRHYWTEPYVWGAGVALSLSTEYLRIGADKHYLTDVVAGGAVGLASGLLIPRLLRRDIKIIPVSNGAAVAGAF